MKLEEVYKIVKRVNLFESVEPEIEAYARAHDLGDVSWEGSGDMGHAYVTDKNTILKTTSDATELKYAQMVVGKKLDNVVTVYDVDDSVIHMGYSEYGSFDDIDIDEHDDMPDEVKEFVTGVQDGMFQLQRSGVNNLDLKDDNIGRKSNGEYAIFDMSSAKENM